MALKLVTPATQDILSLEEVRDHLKCGTDEDNYLQRLIKAAVLHTETVAKLRLSTQTWKQTYHYFPASFEIKLRPFKEITAIRYYDADGQLQELDEEDYRVDLESTPTVVYPLHGADWPATDPSKLNAVEIEYNVGYTHYDTLEEAAEDPNALPEDLKQAVLFLIGHWYANREPVVIGAGVVSVNVPITYDYIISPYREWLF